MDEVCLQLDLVEKDYFGLRFVDVEKQRVSFSKFCTFAPVAVYHSLIRA